MPTAKHVLEKATRNAYPKNAQPPPSKDLENDMSDDYGGSGQGTTAMTREILSRSRRIETRLTSLLVAMGVTNDTQKPKFSAKDSVLQVPSPHSSLKECVAAIPPGWSQPVTVMIDSEKLLVINPAA